MKTPLRFLLKLLGFPLLFGLCANAQQPSSVPSTGETDSLEIVSISPRSPAVLKVGEKVLVTVRYRLTSCDGAGVRALAYTKGQRARSSMQEAPGFFQKGSGELRRSFLAREPTIVDEVRVVMMNDKTKQVIKSASLPIQVEWRAEGAQAATLTPKTPTPPDAHEPLPTKPILRIETGTHLYDIRCISTDAANRFLVTGSGDGTMRLWLLTTGELVRVFRPPYDASSFANRIRHCAISPDGNTIACEQEHGIRGALLKGDYFTIHFFDRLSGRVVQMIKIFDTVLDDMAFSKDGRYFAVQTHQALKIFRAPDYVGTAPIEEAMRSKSIDFAADGRLVTFGNDGFVRLYDAGFKLVAKQAVLGSRPPCAVAFSPDGSKIAVFARPDDLAAVKTAWDARDESKIAVFARNSNNATNKVTVLSAHNLGLLYNPDTTGWSGQIGKVFFSADGTQLIAVVGNRREGIRIRIWDMAGLGKYRDLPMPDGMILPLRSGGFAFFSDGSIWGVLDATGQQKLCIGKNQLIGVRDQKEILVSSDGTFIVSPDGTSIKYKSQEAFSVRERQFVKETGGLMQARTNAPEFRITRDRWSCLLLEGTGKQFRVCNFPVFSAVISPNAEFLLGRNGFGVGLFDHGGTRKWERGLATLPMALNIAGNGQVAAVALGDQTIRWYRMSDGQELLALFIHADEKLWVLWTPSGYYDCAPGAEDLIGWHVNNGEDKAADFYPVSRFRSTFYRPDVVAKMLDTRDEAEALRQADAEAHRKKTETISIEKILPPTVTILVPQFGDTVTTEDIEVRYTTGGGSLDAAVTSVVAMVDGRPLEGNRGVKLVSETAAGDQTIRVPIPRRDCVVSLHAKNRHGVGEAAIVRLKWGGTTQSAAKPKLYALVVGVSAYEAAELQLRYAAKDAGDFGTVLDKQKGGLYREVEMKLLTDKQAMRDEVLSGLKWLSQQTTPNDVAVLFLAGHGVNDTDGSYYYLPVNALTKNLSQTGVRFSEIREALAKITGKALFFVDTCHAGGVLGNRRSVEDLTRLMNEASSAENGVVVFASSTSQQSSLEKDEWHNGAFTKALVEGIRGEAASKVTGLITVKSLDSWLSDKVEQLTGTNQTPTTVWPKGTFDFKNFPVAVPLDKVGSVPSTK